MYNNIKLSKNDKKYLQNNNVCAILLLILNKTGESSNEMLAMG